MSNCDAVLADALPLCLSLLLNKLIVTRVRVCSLVFWFLQQSQGLFSDVLVFATKLGFVLWCFGFATMLGFFLLCFGFATRLGFLSLVFWFCKVLKLCSEKHKLLLACAIFLRLLF